MFEVTVADSLFLYGHRSTALVIHNDVIATALVSAPLTVIVAPVLLGYVLIAATLSSTIVVEVSATISHGTNRAQYFGTTFEDDTDSGCFIVISMIGLMDYHRLMSDRLSALYRLISDRYVGLMTC